MVEEV